MAQFVLLCKSGTEGVGCISDVVSAMSSSLLRRSSRIVALFPSERLNGISIGSTPLASADSVFRLQKSFMIRGTKLGNWVTTVSKCRNPSQAPVQTSSLRCCEMGEETIGIIFLHPNKHRRFPAVTHF